MQKLYRQPDKAGVKILRHKRQPVAVVMDIDDYYDLLEQANPRIQRELEQAREEIEQGKTISHTELMKQLGL